MTEEKKCKILIPGLDRSLCAKCGYVIEPAGLAWLESSVKRDKPSTNTMSELQLQIQREKNKAKKCLARQPRSIPSSSGSGAKERSATKS